MNHLSSTSRDATVNLKEALNGQPPIRSSRLRKWVHEGARIEKELIAVAASNGHANALAIFLATNSDFLNSSVYSLIITHAATTRQNAVVLWLMQQTHPKTGEYIDSTSYGCYEHAIQEAFNHSNKTLLKALLADNKRFLDNKNRLTTMLYTTRHKIDREMWTTMSKLLIDKFIVCGESNFLEEQLTAIEARDPILQTASIRTLVASQIYQLLKQDSSSNGTTDMASATTRKSPRL